MIYLLLYILSFNVLILTYYLSIPSLYSYIGLIDEFSLPNYVLSHFLIVLCCSVIGKDTQTKNFFHHLCMIAALLPVLVVSTGAGRPFEFMLVCTLAFVFLVLTSRFFIVPPILFPKIRRLAIAKVCMVASVGILLGVFSSVGLSYINFDIFAVYEFRRDISDALPFAFSYLNTIAISVLIPVSFLIFLSEKKLYYCLAVAIVSVLFFALTAHKTPLFMPFILAAIYFIVKMNAGARLLIYAFLVGAIVSAADLIIYRQYFLDEVTNLGILGDLFLRRSLLIPAHINFLHYDFFFSGEQYFWSSSRITFGLIEPPYELRAPFMIGLTYFDRPGMSVNSGWIGSGIANAGLYGLLLYSVMIGLLLSFLDSYGRVIGHQTTVALAFLTFLNLFQSTDLLTMFLTHGLMFLLLLLCFIPSKADASHFNRHKSRRRQLKAAF